MLVGEFLELAVGPGVEDPILHIDPSLLGLVAGLIPGGLNLADEGVLVSFGALLSLDALVGEPGLEVLGGPRVVGLDDVVVPVGLDELLEILPIGGSRVGDVVVRQPALELRLVPLVVSWRGGQLSAAMGGKGQRIDVPALENQLLATTPWTARAVRTVWRKRMMDGCTNQSDGEFQELCLGAKRSGIAVFGGN